MPFIAPVILETVLGRLAVLFLTGAGGDHTAARQAANLMLAAYDPRTEAEFSLAADIISFGFHALEALSQSAEPDLKLTAILRLRGSAVSLSREAHKSRRKLDQLQKERRMGEAQPPAEPLAAQPEPEATPDNAQAETPLDTAREAIRSAAKSGSQPWTQQFQHRVAARRIAENLRKNQAAHFAATETQAAGMTG
jgi:hypothetical protein